MADRSALERRIAELRRELSGVEGTATEVYSRIVGYYRSVRNWNAGKRDEFGLRREFSMPGSSAPGSAPAQRPVPAKARSSPQGRAPAEGRTAECDVAESPAGGEELLVFTRVACPNCPPVADYLRSAGISAVFVDVDGEEGLALARRHGVMATPTVLCLDGSGAESFRAYGVAELKTRLGGRPAVAEAARC